MKAIQLLEPRSLQPIQLDEPPKPSSGQALVRTHRIGICGTDYSGYLGKMPFFTYPRIPGHELGVEVLEVGPDVTRVRPGDRCSIEPYMHCGACIACCKGATNCCAQLKVIGVMEDGGMRERFLVRADKLHPSKKLSFEQLALVETLAIGCHATNRANPAREDRVLIIGAGPIGLATLEFTRLTGASVTVMDMVPARLKFCRDRYQVDHTIAFQNDKDALAQIEAWTETQGYNIVIDATGNHISMGQALRYVAPTGALVYVGITTQEISFPHPALHRPEAVIKASRNALPSDFTRIIGLIEDGTIDTDPWITHRTTFDSLIQDFESFTKPESGVIKAVVALT